MIRKIMFQFCLFFLLLVPCFGQEICLDTLDGSFDEVLVDGTRTTGGGCVFSGNAETVTVINGGDFLAFGEDTGVGKLVANGANRIDITGGAYAEYVLSNRTESVRVGLGSSIERLQFNNSGHLELLGVIDTIRAVNSTISLNITGGAVGDGFFSEFSELEATLCNAYINGIEARNSSTSFIAEDSSNCAPTDVSYLVSHGPGNVTVRGVTLKADYSTLFLSGISVHATDFNNLAISSTNISGLFLTESYPGALSLIDVVAEDHVGFRSPGGSVTIEGSEFKGDVIINSTLSTDISGSTFAKAMKLGKPSGEVNLQDNDVALTSLSCK